MKIFVDFDDVLFNTRDFLRDLISACAPYDISPAMWQKIYAERKGDVPGVHAPFTIARFAQILAVRTGKDAHDLESAMNQTMTQLEKYVFSDSIAFLNAFPQEDVFVLTYGDDAFQRARVEGSGISAFVGDIFVTQEQKVKVLQSYLLENSQTKPSEIIYLDDRAVYFGPVKEVFPQVRTMLVARPERRYDDAPNEYCDDAPVSLAEAQRMINQKRETV